MTPFRTCLLILAVTALMLATGCGRKGALYLPDTQESPTTSSSNVKQ